MYVSSSRSLNEVEGAERGMSFHSSSICQLELIDQSIFCVLHFFLVFHVFRLLDASLT
jgi:hypothetical protein